MKVARKAVIAYSIFLAIFLAVWVSAEEEYIPKAAMEAINKSQGRVETTTLRRDENPEIRRAGGFLVSADGWVVTVLHVMSREIDVINQKGRITFNGVVAEVDYVVTLGDLVILKLEKVPDGMQPVVLAGSFSLYSKVFAVLSGGQLLPTGLMINFDKLPFQGMVVNKMPGYVMTPFGLQESPVEFIYLDRAAKGGFSGAMFVNEKGEVVGMGSFLDGGYTALVSVNTIRKAIEDSRRQDKEVEEKKAKDKKE